MPSLKSSPTLFPINAMLAGIIERVIDELEGNAEIATIRLKCRLFATRPPGDHRTDFRCRCEKRRRLGSDHLEIGVLGCRRVMRGSELQHLALGDDRRRVR